MAFVKCNGDEDYHLEFSQDGNVFRLSITMESDISQDGGYSFETVTNEVGIDKEKATLLVKELTDFIKRNSIRIKRVD